VEELSGVEVPRSQGNGICGISGRGKRGRPIGKWKGLPGGWRGIPGRPNGNAKGRPCIR
jgi:hypothetical protein